MRLAVRVQSRAGHIGRQLAQGTVEYGLIIACVALVAITGFAILGPKVAALYSASAAASSAAANASSSGSPAIRVDGS